MADPVSRFVHCPVCHGPYVGRSDSIDGMPDSVPTSYGGGSLICRRCTRAGWGYPYEIGHDLFAPGEEVPDTRAEDGVTWLTARWREWRRLRR